MKGTFLLTGYKFSLGFKTFKHTHTHTHTHEDRSFALLTSTALAGSTRSDQPVTFLDKTELTLCINLEGQFSSLFGKWGFYRLPWVIYGLSL